MGRKNHNQTQLPNHPQKTPRIRPLSALQGQTAALAVATTCLPDVSWEMLLLDDGNLSISKINMLSLKDLKICCFFVQSHQTIWVTQNLSTKKKNIFKEKKARLGWISWNPLMKGIGNHRAPNQQINHYPWDPCMAQHIYLHENHKHQINV